MGETVEMIMGGLICSQCGEWMGDFEETGYPRVCEDCEESATENNRKEDE